jgi:large subunit ribosomal protein L9
MKVILQKDFESLGHIGDTVKVSDGYGQNFLIPRGIAVRADVKNVAQMAHLRNMAEAEKKRARSDAQTLADRINGTAISLRRAAGDEERLFGSVTNRDIAEALAAEGIELDRKLVVLEEPIKTIGVFSVPVRLHPEVEARIKVYVIRE